VMSPLVVPHLTMVSSFSDAAIVPLLKNFVCQSIVEGGSSNLIRCRLYRNWKCMREVGLTIVQRDFEEKRFLK
jgi:hypothetical protein